MKAQNVVLPKSVSQVGFWSSIAVEVWTTWFLVAYASYQVAMPVWRGIDAFAASFQPLPYLAWVVPCFLLALTFVVLISSIHFYVSGEKKIWSWLGVVFALIYGAVLGATYWLLMTVVREGLAGGHTEGIARLVVHSPGSIGNSLEGLGYGLMGLATLFSGLAMDGGRLESWIRRLLVANGVASVASVVAGVFGLMWATFAGLVFWFLTLVAAVALLAVLFRPAGRLPASAQAQPWVGAAPMTAPNHDTRCKEG